MTYVENNNNGYVSFNRKNYMTFFEENSHDSLLKYVNADISDITDLFEKHVSARMDINTFEIKESKTNGFLEKIKNKLTHAHPYYKYEYQKIIIREIGIYFNRLLVYSLYEEHNPALSPNLSKEWYIERIRALMPSPSKVGSVIKKNNTAFSNWTDNDYPEGLYPSDFYYYFIKWTKVSEETADFVNEILIYDVPKQPPTGFEDELKIHYSICNMLYFILDVSMQTLNNLNPRQRLYIYGLMFKEELTIKEHLSPHSRILLQYPTDKGNEKQDIHANTQAIKEYDIYSSLFNLNALNTAHIDDIPPYILENINQAVKYASLSSPPKIYREYEIESLYQLLYLEILSMVKANTLIKRCENCDKYFIPTKKEPTYCNFTYQSGKSCHDLRKYIKWNKKLSNDLPLKAYINSYKTHHARFKRGIITNDELHNWMDKAKRKLAEVREGNLDISSFTDWLKI